MLSWRVGLFLVERGFYIHFFHFFFQSEKWYEMGKWKIRGIYMFGALTLFETKLKLLQSCGYEALESEHVVF